MSLKNIALGVSHLGKIPEVYLFRYRKGNPGLATEKIEFWSQVRFAFLERTIREIGEGVGIEETVVAPDGQEWVLTLRRKP